MNNVPLNREAVDKIIADNKIKSVGKASIREVKKIIDDIEKSFDFKFVRMEMGIPGLPTVKVGVDAQIQALKDGVSAIYPDIYGTAELKHETKRFVKNFLDVDVPENSCVPVTGSMQGSFASFMTVTKMDAKKNKLLFIDPGFPVQKQQCKIMGISIETFDVYQYRGEKLRAKVESYLKTGEIAGIVYSSPNNPAWFCFTQEELKTIAELANQYDVVVMEDLAYFGMDFRKDISQPGVAPFQPTVAKWAKKYILMISGSKAFSYAGERIAVIVISPELYDWHTDYMKTYFAQDTFGRAIVFGSIYALSSGTSHSVQYGLAAIMKACNDGTYNLVEALRDYEKKAKFMKDALVENGFEIVYDKDQDVPIADGFYFTFNYPGMTGEQTLNELTYYGISAICLDITGSDQQGLRACVSLVPHQMLPTFAERVKQFNEDHKK
ncbi:MAG: pyridoxal phosphate-dependent aminotransferase [Bacteroidales bacterium]|nr:pyridoxal phosphate-dependent aminotransferase [Bacteroidales bacterium]